jgi:hypothetical protein
VVLFLNTETNPDLACLNDGKIPRNKVVSMTISIKVHQTQLQYYILWGRLHVSASKRPSSGHPLVNKSIKSKPYEIPAHYGIPCGFTRIVMDKNKIKQFIYVKQIDMWEV